MQSTPPQPDRTPAQKGAVRDWALLLGGTSVGVVLLATAWLGVSLARRRKHLLALKQDTQVRRSRERDAWEESAKRLRTPTAQDLEEDGETHEGAEPRDPRDPRDPREPEKPGEPGERNA